MKKQMDRFLLGAALGKGILYRAEEVLPGNLRRPVALQLFPPVSAKDQPGQERFLTFLRTLLLVEGHPHIVTCYAVGLTDDTPWLAMELLPDNLARRLAETPSPAGEVARMLEQITGALAFLQGRTPPLLHNHLKPANILLDAFGRYKLTDFAAAAPVGVESTRALDTVRYAAPELLNRDFGPVGPATDLYALGHIAYEMALGSKLYRSQFPAVFADKSALRTGEVPPALWMQWHCSLSTAPPAVHELINGFPESLSRVIVRLNAKPLAERYATATAVLADLQPAASPIGAAETAVLVPAPSPGGAPAPAAGGSGRYFVRLRGRQTGPFDMASLQRQARHGQLSRLHQISTDQVNWQPAAAVEGLFGH